MKPRILSPSRLSFPLAAAIAALLAAQSAQAQSWSGATSGDWLTTTNWTGGVAAGSTTSTDTDIAVFGVNAFNTVGINMTTTSGVYYLGAIDNTNATARIFNNSSTTTAGILTLNGATVNSVANTILRNSTTTLMTITNGTGSGTLGLGLGNATDNVIQITGTGGVTISSIISGASKNLTLQGSGAGVLSLTGANTYSGSTTLNAGPTAASGNLTLSGTGTILNTSGITLNGGILQLTNTSVVNRVNDSATITSNGGRIIFSNATGATNYTETLGSVALNTGHLGISHANNFAAQTGSQTLTLGGLSTTGTGTVLFAGVANPDLTKNVFVVTGGGTTAAGGIIAPWAVVNTLATATNVTTADYAKYSGDKIVAAAITATTTATLGVTDGSNVHWAPTATASLSATTTVNTLRMTGGQNGFSLGANNLVTRGIMPSTSGGMTISQGTGSGVVTIPNVADAAANLYISNVGKTLNINAAITDNGAAKLTLVKSGLGGAVSSGNLVLGSTGNSYSGDTVINQGDLNLNAANVIPDGAGKGDLYLNGSDARLTMNNNLGSPTSYSETINGLYGTGVVRNNATTGNVTLTVGGGNANGNFSGTLINGGAAALALTKIGTGTQTLSGVNTYTGATNVNGGKLVVNGTGSINSSSSLTISSGATFRYNSSTALTISSANITNNGTIAGSGNLTGITLGGAGSVDPGNSPGILTATATNPSGGLDYNFEMTAANTLPTWDNATASVNDVLRLTGATPFSSNLDSVNGNVISVYFGSAITLTAGDIFTGGFYTDNNSDFLSAISSATFQYFVYNGVSGTNYNGIFYDLYSGPLAINVSTVSLSADFDGVGGNPAVNGYVTQFTVVPETSTALLSGLGALALLRRKRKSEG